MTVQTLSPSRPPTLCLWGSRYLGGRETPSSPVTPGLLSPGPRPLDSSPAVLMLQGIFRKELFLLVPRLWAFFEHYLLRRLQMHFSLCGMV